MKSKNPFKGTKFNTPVVASELRFADSSERAFDNNMELNANDKKGLLVQISKLINVANTKGIETAEDQMSRQEKVAKRKEALIAAFASKEAHIEVGELMGEDLYLAANREGFARRFLQRQELSQGQLPQVRMRMKNVVAQIASSPSKIQTQIIRDEMFFPPEFYITARPFVEKKEIDQSTSDVLEEKYIESLEAVMIGEDRVFYKLAKATVGIDNPQTLAVGQLSPSTLTVMRNQVTRWNIPAAYWLIANDLWNDIISNSGFQAIIDPVSKFELLRTGLLGAVLGMQIYSDAYRHPQQKVLAQGEHFIIGAQENLGQYTDRGGVSSTPIDSTTEGIPGKGWMLEESLSMTIANSRAISFGVRS